jgi:hypothetical protein
VSLETRKALESGMLQGFEQKRSKCFKRLTRKGLSYPGKPRFGGSGDALKHIKFGAISTDGGHA